MKTYIDEIIEWENDISDWEKDDNEWQKELKKIKKLKTKQDIINYYLVDRGFQYENDLIIYLLYFIASLD